MKALLKQVQEYLKTESLETKLMLEVYLKYTKGLASKEELMEANTQLKDIFKNINFGVFALLPFAVITIPGLFYIAKKYQIDIIPDWFKKNKKLAVSSESIKEVL